MNPHAHSLVPDGVFAFEPEQPVTFVELPAPSQQQLEAVLATIVRRVSRSLERSTQRQDRDLEAELEDDPLAQAQARAVQLRLQPTGLSDESSAPQPQPLCARQQGFSLHAGITVAANDQQGRLRLLRYGARPALTRQHLSLLPDGRVRYPLRRSAGPGSSDALILQPTELLHRLAAIMPRPYLHRTVYHGIFAPAASRRFEVTPAAARRRGCCSTRRGQPRSDRPDPLPASGERVYTLVAHPHDHTTRSEAHARGAAAADGEADAAADAAADAQAALRFCIPPLRPKGGRIPWAELIRRTFPDALDCPTCGGTLSVIAYITEATVLRKILTHLGLPARSPQLAPARLPRELSFDFEGDDPRGSSADAAEPLAGGAASDRCKARGPPECDSGL